MREKILLIMGLVALMFAPATAQSVSLGPQVGYYKTRDADEGNPRQ